MLPASQPSLEEPMRILHSAVLSLLLVAPLAPACDASLAGFALPEKAEVKGQSLMLTGIALRKKFFIKVYVAGLYLPQKKKSAAKTLGADAPRRQVMHFLY